MMTSTVHTHGIPSDDSEDDEEIRQRSQIVHGNEITTEATRDHRFENHNYHEQISVEGHVESSVLSPNLDEEKMRRRLQFFFMNPIEKWQAKRRFPYKFFVQVIKIILVTLQLCLFAHSRYKHVNYTWDNRVTFSHLFLRGWDITMEVNVYPPETGPLACYVVDDFFNTID